MSSSQGKILRRVEGALSPVCPSSQKIHMIQVIDIE